MCSSQVGKTEVILNTIGYFVDHDPAPILLIQPTLDMAESFSKDRLTPMFRDTPPLQKKFLDNRQKQSNNTLLHKKYPGGHITLAGANSPASLSSRPIRLVLCDEVDRYPPSAGREGDPVSLAEKRSSTFYNRKAILFSTPVTKGESKIEREFLESDQRYYFVPCPLCNHKQRLVWKNLEWNAGRPETCQYRCESCHRLFDDSHKQDMLQNGEWVAHEPFMGTAGFHISELYSPWTTWQEMVDSFLKAKKNVEELKTWTNTALGEVWEEKGEAPEWERLYERREPYEIGSVPRGVLFLTAGVDVQDNRIEVEIVGWGRDKQSWSIDHRVIEGNTADGKTWLKLGEILNETFLTEDDTVLTIRVMAVDSGFRTQTVYDWCRKHPITRVIAIKGNENAQVIIGKGSSTDLKRGGQTMRRGFKFFTVGVNIVKSELYGWLKLPKPVDTEPFPEGYCHFPEYGEEFFKQLTSEHLVKKRIRRGRYIHTWQKLRDRNEALDMRIYARAAASYFGMDQFKDHHWDEIEEQIYPKKNKEFEKSYKLKRRKSTFL